MLSARICVICRKPSFHPSIFPLHRFCHFYFMIAAQPLCYRSETNYYGKTLGTEIYPQPPSLMLINAEIIMSWRSVTGITGKKIAHS